jgi:glycerol-1-phosphate dehydrogenase [NAD(P)+]
MPVKIEIEVVEDAPARLLDYCRERGRKALHLVADEHTMEALGASLERSVRAASLDLRSTVFGTEPLVAGAESVFRLLLDLDEREDRLLIAVGSGTITDIVRFVAHRSGRDFVSIPTAPSVDAYASVVAPLVVAGVKRTVAAKPPLAIFADLGVLRAAPRPMIAAGFGDMICKFTAVADWRLSALLWAEGYDESIAERSLASVRKCVDVAEGIGIRGCARQRRGRRSRRLVGHVGHRHSGIDGNDRGRTRARSR